MAGSIFEKDGFTIFSKFHTYIYSLTNTFTFIKHNGQIMILSFSIEHRALCKSVTKKFIYIM